MNLYYIMDPMCSWCWAFRPSFLALLGDMEDGVAVRYVMGGLAPDSEDPMPEAMRRGIQQTWRTIEAHTGAVFNHDFWTDNTPRRSTYPACRAAIAAGRMRPGALAEMVEAIQLAYYRDARNPSCEHVLCELAESIGLDRAEFAQTLHAEVVRAELARHLELTRRLGVTGFPTLVAVTTGNGASRYALVSAGYCDRETLAGRWRQARRELAVDQGMTSN